MCRLGAVIVIIHVACERTIQKGYYTLYMYIENSQG